MELEPRTIYSRQVLLCLPGVLFLFLLIASCSFFVDCCLFLVPCPLFVVRSVFVVFTLIVPCSLFVVH